MDEQDRNTMLYQAERFLDQLKDADDLQMTMAAMAHAIQMQLSLARSPIKYADALDNIMRAVAHAIEDSPDSRNYVLQKLGSGHTYLTNWYGKE